MSAGYLCVLFQREMLEEMDGLRQGYDFEFTTNVSNEYICKICHLALRKPVQTKCCGHRFCKECLQAAIKGKAESECPMDRQALDIHQDVFDDKGAERTVNSLVIYCPCDGCQWQGELGNVEDHLQKCDYKFIKCSNEECDIMQPRMAMASHEQECEWREVQCQHCKQRKKFNELRAHEENCEYKIIKCSYKECKVMKPKMDMTNHLQECIWRKVNCPHCWNVYYFFELQDHTKVCPKLIVSCPNGCGEEAMNEEVSDHVINECPLTPVPCIYQQFGCQFMAQRKDKKWDDHMDQDMKDHLGLTFKYLALASDQLKALQEKNVSMSERLSILEGENASMSKHLSLLQDENEKLKKTASEMMFGNNFVWKISNIKQKLQNAKQGGTCVLYSDPFYTEKYGYKLRVMLYPNGSSAEHSEHLSVYSEILQGEYDALLPWPFAKDVTFTLVDQKKIVKNRKNVKMTANSKNSLVHLPHCFERPTSKPNVGCGFPNFVPHKKLTTKSYILEDSIFLLVDVTDPPAK